MAASQRPPTRPRSHVGASAESPRPSPATTVERRCGPVHPTLTRRVAGDAAARGATLDEGRSALCHGHRAPETSTETAGTLAQSASIERSLQDTASQGVDRGSTRAREAPKARAAFNVQTRFTAALDPCRREDPVRTARRRTSTTSCWGDRRSTRSRSAEPCSAAHPRSATPRRTAPTLSRHPSSTLSWSRRLAPARSGAAQRTTHRGCPTDVGCTCGSAPPVGAPRRRSTAHLEERLAATTKAHKAVRAAGGHLRWPRTDSALALLSVARPRTARTST